MHRIKEVMTEKGETMETLSAKLGVTKQALYANMQAPSFQKLLQIAAALDVELWELFKDEQEILAKHQKKGGVVGELLCPHCGKECELHAQGSHIELIAKNTE